MSRDEVDNIFSALTVIACVGNGKVGVGVKVILTYPVKMLLEIKTAVPPCGKTRTPLVGFQE